jgi:STAS domain
MLPIPATPEPRRIIPRRMSEMTMVMQAEQGMRFEVGHRHAGRASRELLSLVGHALQQGDRRVVADCQGWERLDVTVLSSLIRCAQRCREYGASFEVVNLSPDLTGEVRDLRLLTRLGLTD